MKRKCKKVNIADYNLILQAVHDCFKNYKKRRRADTIRLFAKTLNVSRTEAKVILHDKTEQYYVGMELIAKDLQTAIQNQQLKLPNVRQEQRIDPGSKKVRNISVLGIRQLLFDHVAVLALADLSKRIGEYQVSSIKGRGAAYGKKAIEKWLNNKMKHYAVKLDIKDFYGSFNREALMQWLTKRVGNKPLLWLINSLISNVPTGIAIGSFLSQTLANIYLSDLYHTVSECKLAKRKPKSVHVLFYMDDMLLTCTNKRYLKKLVQLLLKKAEELQLTIKNNWQIHEVCRQHPIDAMGYRFSNRLTTLRKRIFKAARRTLLRADKKIKQYHSLSEYIARRLASFNGYTGNTNCTYFLNNIHANSIYTIAFNYA